MSSKWSFCFAKFTVIIDFSNLISFNTITRKENINVEIKLRLSEILKSCLIFFSYNANTEQPSVGLLINILLYFNFRHYWG